MIQAGVGSNSISFITLYSINSPGENIQFPFGNISPLKNKTGRDKTGFIY